MAQILGSVKKWKEIFCYVAKIKLCFGGMRRNVVKV